MSRRSRETIGPNVVIPTMTESNPRSAVEQIAAFAAAARPERLTNETLPLFKRNILDSIGCAIAALPGQPFQALREQFEEYRAPGRCTLIGGGKTSADQAALFNSGLVRYVDLLDSYMAPGGLCHPSDNFGTVLAAAEQAGASGEEFMLGLAIAYEIQCRFSAAVRCSSDLGPDGPARPGSAERRLSGNSPRHSVNTKVAGFRPSSRNPHKSASDPQFNQIVSR